MNLDARSARSNTEIGLVIDSPEPITIASGVLYRNLLTSGAYELRLTPDREHIEWLETGPDDSVVVHQREPESA